MRPKRQGIIVWYRNRRNLKHLRRFGHLLYSSQKMRYALIYVNQDDMNQIEERLQKQSFVIKTERSLKPFIRTKFDKKDIAQAKEYDYHIGI